MIGGQALVVGATSEIGTAVAEGLASEVDRLVLWGRDPDRLAGAAESCRATGPEVEVETRPVDVTRSGELADGVAALRHIVRFNLLVRRGDAFAPGLPERYRPG